MRHTIIDASQLELEEKVVSIKRVTKVVKGGRTMRFTALVVVGDGNGHVGAGLGKAAEIPEAIRKGKEDAIKKLVTVARDENNSITHDYIGKFGSAELLMKRAPERAFCPLCPLPAVLPFPEPCPRPLRKSSLCLEPSAGLKLDKSIVAPPSILITLLQLLLNAEPV